MRRNRPFGGGTRTSTRNAPRDSRAKSVTRGAISAPDGVDRQATRPLTIVGIGASAGGLEALKQLLIHLPPDAGMGFVYIQHLDPTHQSMIAAILRHSTTMPVYEAGGSARVEANSIYVIPPNHDLRLLDGMLYLEPRSSTHGIHMPIDRFFASLARDRREHAVGVLLSGTGSDGTIGMGIIKSEGGITLAQDEASAMHSGMPHSAIAAGHVDIVATPEGIARQLIHIGRHARDGGILGEATAESERFLAPLFARLREATGVDFSLYKRSTVGRRITRRMFLNHIERLDEYVRFVRENALETDALQRDLLIGVTQFFRDRDAFQTLANIVFPELIREPRSEESPIRVWVPGCSSGEECYPIGISLLEFLRDRGLQIRVQIFGTDLSEAMVRTARVGLYPESIGRQVPQPLLARYFTRTVDSYRVSNGLRETCIFSRHNVISDPPFLRLDLVSCRNMLIYMTPELQRRVLSVFDFALKPAGFLMLGGAETTSALPEPFSPLDKHHNIFRKRQPPPGVSAAVALLTAHSSPRKESVRAIDPAVSTHRDVSRQAEHILLGKYTPPAVLVTDALEIIEFYGNVGGYFAPAHGQASLNLLQMVGSGLVTTLPGAIDAARRKNATVKRRAIGVGAAGRTTEVTLEVIPLISRGLRHFVVVFHPAPPEKSAARGRAADARLAQSIPGDRRRVVRLTRELAAAKRYLNAIIAEKEQRNEELQSANEEAVSASEELQAANEELETAKEELQSTNEELTTLNEQLQQRNTELTELGNDLQNLLGGIEIPIVIVDRSLRFRRITSLATKSLGVLPGDLGRPLHEVRLSIEGPELLSTITQVIATGAPREFEARGADAHWYAVRIRPYLVENRVDGAILIFADVNELKTKSTALEAALDRAQRIVDFLAALSHELRTPLASMLMWLDVLGEKDLPAEEAARGMEVVKRTAETQLHLVDDLLDVSRIVHGKMHIDSKPVDFSAVVDATIEIMGPPAIAKEIKLEPRIEPVVGLVVMGDRARLQQVITNLLSNAVKFTPAGGWIIVRLEYLGGRVRLSVQDSGKGMSSEFLSRIAQPFQQEGGRAENSLGLGLGLAIAKSIVELHGGTLSAHSGGEGMGATLVVELPVAQAGHGLARESGALGTPAERTVAEAAPGDLLKGIRILCVEDDSDTRLAIAAALKRYGADVIAASSSAEAFDEIRRSPPDVLISDIGLPDQDGYSLNRKVRSLRPERGGRIPALAFTGYAGSEDRQHALKAGFQAQLGKPASAASLAKAVAGLVGSASEFPDGGKNS